MPSKPDIIVFDLDYTLWPFWVDTHVDPPFHLDKKGKICDSRGKKIKCYPDTPSILQELHDEGYDLGVASRTSEIHGANQLLELFQWNKYFKYKEIYPGCKITHFERIQGKSRVDFSRMLFFDDEHRNLVDLKKIGVLTKLVPKGISKDAIKAGLDEFQRLRS